MRQYLNNIGANPPHPPPSIKSQKGSDSDDDDDEEMTRKRGSYLFIKEINARNFERADQFCNRSMCYL